MHSSLSYVVLDVASDVVWYVLRSALWRTCQIVVWQPFKCWDDVEKVISLQLYVRISTEWVTCLCLLFKTTEPQGLLMFDHVRLDTLVDVHTCPFIRDRSTHLVGREWHLTDILWSKKVIQNYKYTSASSFRISTLGFTFTSQWQLDGLRNVFWLISKSVNEQFWLKGQYCSDMEHFRIIQASKSISWQIHQLEEAITMVTNVSTYK